VLFVRIVGGVYRPGFALMFLVLLTCNVIYLFLVYIYIYICVCVCVCVCVFVFVLAFLNLTSRLSSSLQSVLSTLFLWTFVFVVFLVSMWTFIFQ
jgi:hypothetical protein